MEGKTREGPWAAGAVSKRKPIENKSQLDVMSQRGGGGKGNEGSEGEEGGSQNAHLPRSAFPRKKRRKCVQRKKEEKERKTREGSP